MIVLEVDPEASALARAVVALRTAQDRQRPSGLHLSTILEDRFALLKPIKRSLNDRALAFQESGSAYEDLLAEAFRQRYVTWHKPDPVRHRRIWCSPDGFNGAVLDEMKATWISSREFVTTSANGTITGCSLKFLRYQWQVLGYMKAFKVRRARLHVWFLCGDHRPPLPERPRTFLLRASDEEVQENWDRVEEHARDRGMLT